MAVYTLVTTTWADAAPAISSIRRRVFILEQGVAEYEEWDAADRDAIHVLGLREKRDPVATGRLERSGKLGRVAVVSEHRQRGLGMRVMKHLLAEARQQRMENVYLHAQLHAKPFYGQLDFRPVGPTFMEAGIAHVRMELKLNTESHGKR